MERVEQNLMEPVSNVNLENTKVEVSRGLRRLSFKLESLLIQQGFALFLIGFLLGRALILSHLTPFALPFFAAVYMIRRDRAPIALIGLLAGSLTLSLENITYTFSITILFLISYRLSSKYFQKAELRALPFFVLFTTLTVKLLFIYVQHNQIITTYDLLMAGVEAGLTFILTLIFMQSIPLLSFNKRKRTLKTEEIVSLVILLASVMTGTIGWSLYGLSVEHIFSRYLVLVFAFIAGASVGSTVGVVTGLIFSLANVSSFYQMSLLAFAGLLGGLLREGKKVGTALGLIVATLLIGMYGEAEGSLTQSLYESAAAMFFLLLTPRSLTGKLAKHIPGTVEHSNEQQQYLRKMRDVTSNRVEQFASVFKALSNSFLKMHNGNEEDVEQRELDYFLSNVTEKTCQTCFKKEQCWAKNFHQTYEMMENIVYEVDHGNPNLSQRMSRELEKNCVKGQRVQEAIRQELTHYQANLKLKKQVYESRKLVADQLLGVSKVMGDFAMEIQRERENHYSQEEQIFEAMKIFDIEVENVEIYSLQEGNVDIDMVIPYTSGHGECEKLVAPMLSDILGETIVVQKEEHAGFPGGYCHATFRSAKAYVVESGVAHAAKGGGLVSGDSYSTIDLGSGKYAVAISDGMGNGERAHRESNETLSLLQKILKSGIEEKVAIKSVNSILALRTTDEIFSTLDLAIIDLQDATSKYLKIGSTPSFIKRGDKIIKVEASNLPIGILHDVEVDVVTEQLKAGDLLIMMSDGIFEGPKHVENYDVWMKRKISEIETSDPQEVADLLMEEVIRTRSGEIEDDMTVVVVKIQHNLPKWASIPVSKYKKEKQVS
ncbi:stage II sporulation protein E [Oikeobacillus pervagus]|uniref:Stage II sporulation protein E n=1 Tax=Oikeobacillus pervagus TaxID=1325931 RepID=A0AAJ1T0B2_9BACI|nr:stage II sporulation protein E [Oikeobacillus pervagus]MDQ0216184.1 stage II sporulation protein E [Oikeobacillus pervagus]